MDVDDTLKLKSVFTSPWKVDATKAKRECFALCRLLVAHDPHVLEYNYGKEEDEKRNALLLSNDEFDVFCEMLKDDGNIVMGSSIRGSRMLDWWFPRCLFECLSFMASRELFCGIEEDLQLPHPLERASKLLRHGGGRQLSNFESPVVGGEFYETFRHSRALCCVDECSFVRGRNDAR